MAVQDHFGLKLTWAKNNFFDREAVLRRTEAAERKVLSRAGAFVRTRARTSIKRRKGISAPGTPPNAHIKGTDGVKKILFMYDPRKATVIIGPVKFNSHGNVTVPGLLEYGGTKRDEVTVTRTRSKQKGSKGRFTGAIKSRRRINHRYLARPFMRPALALEAPKFPQLWKDAVR